MGANLSQTIDAVFWLTVIFAGLLWALYARHIRNCEETPQHDAKPSAADENASRTEMLAQQMKQVDR
jgi:hypothetical protein